MKNLLTILFISFIITQCIKSPDLGDGYKLDSDGKYSLQIVNSENTVIINAHILEYAFDSTFVIIMQRPWDSIPNVKEMNYNEANNAFKQSLFHQYWILNKKMKGVYLYDSISKEVTYSNVYGPFKKDGYLLKKKELGVSESLKFKTE